MPGRIHISPPILVAAAATLAAGTARAQAFDPERCTGLLFSTEEDFVSEAVETEDGNPLISDGDILAFEGGTVRVCARNLALLERFDFSQGTRPAGLDALDVVSVSGEPVVAFSTDTDHPFGGISDGDLLFSTGARISGDALTERLSRNLGLRGGLGLDAIQFVGDPDRLEEVIGRLAEGEVPAEELLSFMEEGGVDILYSIEATGPTADAPVVLDGDLISAVSGAVVRPQGDLFAGYPAGLPSDGTDYGLDAFVAEREAREGEEGLLSSEIGQVGEPEPFAEGDLLRSGTAVALPAEAIADALGRPDLRPGLDALAFGVGEGQPGARIEQICLEPVEDLSPDGYILDVVARGDGAPAERIERPCGGDVAIEANLPRGTRAYRVRYEGVGPSAGTAGVVTLSRLYREEVVPGLCAETSFGPITDPTGAGGDGWFDYAEYLAMTTSPCATPAHLSVWRSRDAVAGTGTFDIVVEYLDAAGSAQEIRLREVDAGGTVRRAGIVIDNAPPEMVDPQRVVLRDPATGELIGACGETGVSGPFSIETAFRDDHFSHFVVRVTGGDPTRARTLRTPAGAAVAGASHWYFDTVAASGLTPQGTAAFPAFASVRDFDLTADGLDFGGEACCYALRLEVYDRTRVLRLVGGQPYVAPAGSHRTNGHLTFGAGA